MKAKLSASQAKLMIFLILLTNVVPPLSIDEYTPSLPYMVHALGTHVSLMQLTVSFYMLTFALSQAACGALSDRFGRRPVLLWSAPFYFLGTLIVIFTPNMSFLIVGRLLQGLGVGASALTGPALMADCFEGDDLTRIGGYYGMVYSFIPISAPIIGGLIQTYFGWRYNFVFMLVLAAIIYALFTKFLPETHIPDESHRLSLKNTLGNYLKVITNKTYILAVASLMMLWTLFIVFSIMAPFLMQDVLGFSAKAYGFQALLTGLGFFVGSYVNNQLLKIISANKALMIGLLGMIAFSVVLLALPLFGIVNAWGILAPIFITMIAAGISFPHLYGRAVSAVPENAGIAGALIGTLILLGAVIISALLTLLHAHSPVTMAGAFLILSVIASLLSLLNR